MELVYLWVDSYKNIQNQGFNFSPRFTCRYENGELTIDENKEHVSIFPDNINVTAIVGENGSGKSSILELLPYGAKMTDASKLIFLFFKKDDKYILLKPISKIIKISKNLEKKVEEENISTFDFSNKNTIKRISFDTDFTKENFIDKDLLSFFGNVVNFGFSFKENYLENSNKIFNIEKYKHVSNILTYILKDELINLNVFFRPTYIKISNYDKSNSNLKIEEIIEELRKEENENNGLINELETNKNLLSEFEYNQKIVMNDLDKIKILFELPVQNYFYIDFYNEKDISFSEFSQGERGFYIHFLFLMFINKNHSESKENENTFFLIDEPDTTFHPNWQKKYINQLLNIYKTYKKNVHLIMTSHSPFLLSDLPKENVIFLEKGKQVDVDINTFGANIHTLLSHGFFMKDGLMGEFAKEKINQIKEFYDENKNLKKEDTNFLNIQSDYKLKKDSFRHIQSIIGEPFLKTIMGNYLDELELIFSDDNDLIDIELKVLEERKKYLEKLKNAKN
ncbi:MAG: AAA family ATPase [Sulfurimonas sp.]|jgi:predicted ATPase